MVVSAGCVALGGGDGAEYSAPLNDVPAEADGLVHVQTAVFDDSVAKTVINQTEIGNERKGDWETLEEIIDHAAWDDHLTVTDTETNISVHDVHSLTTFTGSESKPEEADAGIIISTLRRKRIRSPASHNWSSTRLTDDDADPGDSPVDFLFNSTTVDASDDRVSLASRVGPEELATAFETIDEPADSLPVTANVWSNESVAAD